LRPAEAIGLRCSDVEVGERRLTVRQTIQRICTYPGAERGRRRRLVVDESKSDAEPVSLTCTRGRRPRATSEPRQSW
jgi:hypothetical protein